MKDKVLEETLKTVYGMIKQRIENENKEKSEVELLLNDLFVLFVAMPLVVVLLSIVSILLSILAILASVVNVFVSTYKYVKSLFKG